MGWGRAGQDWVVFWPIEGRGGVTSANRIDDAFRPNVVFRDSRGFVC